MVKFSETPRLFHSTFVSFAKVIEKFQKLPKLFIICKQSLTRL